VGAGDADATASAEAVSRLCSAGVAVKPDACATVQHCSYNNAMAKSPFKARTQHFQHWTSADVQHAFGTYPEAIFFRCSCVFTALVRRLPRRVLCRPRAPCPTCARALLQATHLLCWRVSRTAHQRTPPPSALAWHRLVSCVHLKHPCGGEHGACGTLQCDCCYRFCLQTPVVL
jgi:hypothetical protein